MLLVAIGVLVVAALFLARGDGGAQVPVGDGWTEVPGWTRVPPPDGGFVQTLHSVTAYQDGLVAAGYGLWSSGDGQAWGLVADGCTLDEFDDRSYFCSAELYQVLSTSAGGFVAVGTVELEDITLPGTEQRSSAVWTSIDGTEWRQSEHSLQARDGGSMTGVAELGDRLVAVGEVEGGPAAWWSDDDGLTWSSVPNDPAAFGHVGGQINVVIATEAGFVAGGTVCPEPNAFKDCDAAVWISGDGETWRWLRIGAFWGGVEPNQPWGGGAVNDMLRLSSGRLLAVGQDGWHAAVWFSEEGETWLQHELPDAITNGTEIQAIASAADGTLVGVGRNRNLSSAFGFDDGYVWTSPDGETWSREHFGEYHTLDDVAIHGDTIIVKSGSTMWTRQHES